MGVSELETVKYIIICYQKNINWATNMNSAPVKKVGLLELLSKWISDPRGVILYSRLLCVIEEIRIKDLKQK